MAQGSHPGRRPLATAALAAAALVLSLALLELAVRAAWPYVAPTHEVQAERIARMVATAEREAAREPEGGAEPDEELPRLTTLRDLMRPNARGLYKNVVHRTNSAGFRGPEYTPRPEPGVFRIAVTGDSITMGAGVEESETYSAQLEELLDADGDGRRYEVMNLGLAGINLAWSVRRVEKIGMRYHPDLIVYGFTPNDIESRAYESLPGDGGHAREERNRRLRESPSYLLRAVWPRLHQLRGLVAPPEGSYAYEIEHNYFHNAAAWRELTSWLDRFAELADEAGICGHVLIHTQLVQLGWLHPLEAIYDKVAEAARARGLGVTETLDAFRGRRAIDLWVHAGDSHPNPEGHALFARLLHDGLRGLPERCWRPGARAGTRPSNDRRP